MTVRRVSATTFRITEHARQRWAERVGAGDIDAAVRRLVSPNRAQAVPMRRWWRRAIDWRTHSVFLDPVTQAVILCEYEGVGRAVVVTVTSMRLCLPDAVHATLGGGLAR